MRSIVTFISKIAGLNKLSQDIFIKTYPSYLVLDITGGTKLGGKIFTSIKNELSYRFLKKKLPFRFDENLFARRVHNNVYQGIGDKKNQLDMTFDGDAQCVYLKHRDGNIILKMEKVLFTDVGGFFDESQNPVVSIVDKIVAIVYAFLENKVGHDIVKRSMEIYGLLHPHSEDGKLLQ